MHVTAFSPRETCEAGAGVLDQPAGFGRSEPRMLTWLAFAASEPFGASGRTVAAASPVQAPTVPAASREHRGNKGIATDKGPGASGHHFELYLSSALAEHSRAVEVPRPRPTLEVHRQLRRSVPHSGHQDHQDASSRPRANASASQSPPARPGSPPGARRRRRRPSDDSAPAKLTRRPRSPARRERTCAC